LTKVQSSGWLLAGLRLEERYRRHVNRRTGRRAGEFFEDVLVART